MKALASLFAFCIALRLHPWRTSWLIVAWALVGLRAIAQPASDPWEPRLLEGRIDGLIEAQRQAHHIAGAAVVVVRDGRVLLAKGYGYADFGERKPVDTQRTLFRVGSNSKLFVWTAVMQLVEEGRLDLCTDINRYLRSFQIPPAFGEPITLAHLMSHTAGFEDQAVGLMARDVSRMKPLAEQMKRDLPRRVFPPGKVTAYSNYGAALAGLIVEEVSGMPIERYLEEKLLKPIGMTHSTLVQPVPSALAGKLSKGYRWRDGRFEERPFELVSWPPCGAMSASATDMGRFMIAHLNDGSLDGASILKPETARLMRAPLIPFSPKANGILHGFLDLSQAGQVIYGHGGSTFAFHSLTALLPEHRAGLFVAYNTDTGPAAVLEFLPAVLELLFPAPLPKEPAPPLMADRAALARFAGAYASSVVSETDFTKIAKLIEVVSIKVDDDGYLVTRHPMFFPPARWRQTEPLVFREVDGHRQLVFREDEKGAVTDVSWSPWGFMTWRKQSSSGSPPVQLGLLFLFATTLLVGALGTPIVALLQRRQAKAPGSRSARGLAWVVCVSFLVGLLLVAAAMADPWETYCEPAAPLKVGLGLWLGASVLTIPLLGFVWLAWRRGWWRRTGRICLTLITSAAVGWSLWLHYWNLLGWHF